VPLSGRVDAGVTGRVGARFLSRDAAGNVRARCRLVLEQAVRNLSTQCLSRVCQFVCGTFGWMAKRIWSVLAGSKFGSGQDLPIMLRRVERQTPKSCS
jgi:hypothetical protein